MKKKRILLFTSLCTLVTFLTGIVAFAGGDTPVIPIHTKHSYSVLVSQTQPTCTEPGETVYKCTGCTKTVTEETDPLGHIFTFNSCSDVDKVELYCHYCDSCYNIRTEKLVNYWDSAFINKAPQRTGTNNSGYLDLDGNGIINAKDYSIIVRAENGGFYID